MTKQEIRKTYKQKRLLLSERERMKLDDMILIQFQQLSFPLDIRLLLNYFPLDKHAEISTNLFARYLEHFIPSLQIAYPVIEFQSNEMEAFIVNDETEFGDNVYGIHEPLNGLLADPELIDLVFVPLLAFDNHGFRVGYGKGFYDRFLKKCRKDVVIVGFSYFDPLENIADKNQFDVPLNFCITPYHLYEF